MTLKKKGRPGARRAPTISDDDDDMGGGDEMDLGGVTVPKAKGRGGAKGAMADQDDMERAISPLHHLCPHLTARARSAPHLRRRFAAPPRPLRMRRRAPPRPTPYYPTPAPRVCSGQDDEMEHMALTPRSMAAGIAAATHAARQRHGGAKGVATADDDDDSMRHDDLDEVVLNDFAWLTHGAAPNQAVRPELLALSSEDWDDEDEDELERTVTMMLRRASLRRSTAAPKKKPKPKGGGGEYAPGMDDEEEPDDLAALMGNLLGHMQDRKQRRRSMRRMRCWFLK